MTRSEIPPLLAGVVLALAGVGLAAAHVAVPDYLTNGAVLMLGAAAGATIPGRSSSTTSPPPAVLLERPPAATPQGQAAIYAEQARAHSDRAAQIGDELRALIAKAQVVAKEQVVPPTSTPTPAPLAAPGQAEPAAGGLS